jgi:hypothetical protein
MNALFGLKPKSPISAKAGEWTENSLCRFAEMFGPDVLRNNPVVLPTPEFFPDDWNGTAEGVIPFLNRVCGYMRVDSSRVSLHCHHEQDDPDVGEKLRDLLPYWEGSRSGAAGTYAPVPEEEKFQITLKLTRKPDLVNLIATLAHELGHVHLLGDRRIASDSPDMEPLTDLVTVFWGLGIFNANSAMKFSQHDDGTKHGWSVQRLGYLPEPMYGYALAYYAWLREEEKPAWAKYLNVNVGSYFRQAAKYIRHEKRRRPF